LKKVWLADRYGGASPDVIVVEIERSWRELLLPRFLHCLLASDAFIAYSMRHAKGAKMPRGSKAAILEYRIPLPPIEVQHEIVSILDDYTGREGELETELEAELEARRRQYAHCRDRLLARSMPDQAAWRELGQIAEFKYGYTAQAIEAGDYRFLRITDIDNRGKLLVDGAKFVAGTQEVADYVVQPGDLLMARTGGTYGKTMLVTVDEPAVYASFLIRIRVDTSVVLPSYYWHFAQSHLYWKQARSMVSTGGQPQFNANVLKLVELPVPPIDEQSRIVGILDSFDALVHDLSIRLSAERAARRKQYEYHRDKLLTFEEAPA
jgi:type I restriction enzyme S subunit